jgi:predicted ATPase
MDTTFKLSSQPKKFCKSMKREKKRRKKEKKRKDYSTLANTGRGNKAENEKGINITATTRLAWIETHRREKP